VVFADVSLPRLSGYDICREIKSNPRHRHVRVVLTAGMLEHFDDAKAVSSRCDAVLKKPFEASAVLSTIAPLVEAARLERPEEPMATPAPATPQSRPAAASATRSEVDPERIRAAVTVALDAAMPAIVDAITEKVLIALGD
jgi:CheY-like chemotaxis protein